MALFSDNCEHNTATSLISEFQWRNTKTVITQRCAGSSVDVCASSSSNKQSSLQWWPHTMQRTAPRSYLSLSSHCWPLWRSQGVGTLLCHSSASCVSVWTVLSSPLLCCMGSLYSLGRYQTWTGAYQYHLSLFLTHSLSLSLFPHLSLSLQSLPHAA